MWCQAPHDCDPGLVGYTWYLLSGWQERSERLYALAADVAAALGKAPRQ